MAADEVAAQTNGSHTEGRAEAVLTLRAVKPEAAEEPHKPLSNLNQPNLVPFSRGRKHFLSEVVRMDKADFPV